MPERIGLEAIFATEEFERGMARYVNAMADAVGRTQQAQGQFNAAGETMAGQLSAGAMAAAVAIGQVLASAVEYVIGKIRDAAAAIVDFGRDAIMITGRVAELNVVLETIGRNAGMDIGYLHGLVEEIKDLGITTDVAQNLLIQFSRWQLNMGQATELARLAQDAAVISMQDSSEALDGLIHGITTMNTRVLRTYGITLPSVIDAQEEYAETLGLTRDELDETQMIQAVLNAVLEQGTQIAGAYEAAMTQPGKRLRSMRRYTQELQEAMAGPLMGAFGSVVDILETFVKGLTAAVDEGGILRPILEAIGYVAENVLGGALEFLRDLFDEIFTKRTLVQPINRLMGAFGRLGDAVGRLAEAFGIVAPEGADIVDFIILAINAAVDFIAGLTTVTDWIADHAPAIREFFQGIGEDADQRFGKIREIIDEVIPKIQEFVDNGLQRIQDWWAENGPTVIEAMDRLKEASGRVFDWLAEQIPAIWGIIEGPLGGMLELILGLVGAIASAITGDWEGAWESLKEGASGMWEGIKAGWMEFVNWVAGWFGTSWEGIKDQWAANWDMFKTIVETTWELIKTAVRTKLGEVITAIGETVGSFVQAGRDLVAGIVSGITSTAGRIANAVMSALQSAWAAATSWLRTGSESKLFAEMGQDIMAGLTEGILAMADLPTRAMEVAVTHMIQPAQAAAASVAGPSAAGPTTINNTTNYDMNFAANYQQAQPGVQVRDDLLAILALARG